MVKTKIIETTEKYDEAGKLVEKITKETTTENGDMFQTPGIKYSSPSIPMQHWWDYQSRCTGIYK